MKKRIFLVTVLSFIFLCGFSNLESIETETEEKSLEELYLDAINGDSDIPINNQKIESNITAYSEKTNEKIDLPTNIYKTAQILKPHNDSDQIIVLTMFQDINTSKLFANYNRGSEKWDSSYGVKAYSRIYITKDGSFVKLTKADGGWTIGDPTIFLTGRRVDLANVGIGSNSLFYNQTMVKYPTGNTFSYNTLSSWKPVSTILNYSVGASTNVTLKKGNSSWTLSLGNKW